MSAGPVGVLKAVPGVVRPFAWSCVARLPGLMTPLAVVVVVQQIRGSYTIAGIASALFAAGTAVGSPVLGRMMQRFGQTRVVQVSSAAGAVLLVAVAVGESRAQPVVLLLLLVSGTLLLGADTLPLLLSAAFVLAGGLGYARSAPVRRLPSGARAPGAAEAPNALAHPGAVAALAVGALTAATMGVIDTALLAVSEQDLGRRALIGVLIAGIVLGSVIGGVVYGGRTWAAPAGRRSAVAQAMLALLAFPVVAATLLPVATLPALLVTLTVFGTLLAPCLILQMAVVDERLPPPARLFGQACLVGANTGGVALGTALGGVAVDLLGGPGALACALPLVTAAALTAWSAARTAAREGAVGVETASHVKDV